MSVVVAVAYWRDGGVYPRAGPRSGKADVYLQGTATMAGSWRRTSSSDDVRFVLCSNIEPQGEIAEQLERLGVERWPVPFASRPPDGYFHKFSASTYSLDVLRAFADRLGPADVLLLVDPDVVWLRDPVPLVASVRRSGLLVYPIPYPPGQRDLGLNRRELTDLVATMSGRDPDGLVHHVGGELVAATPGELRRFAAACDEGWAASVQRFRDGRTPRLNTEEHVFAYAFHALGYRHGTHTTDAIRRVWTRPGRLRNVQGDELGRMAWHALSEKGRGLSAVYDDLVSGTGVFAPALDDDAYRRRLARRLSVDPSPWTRVSLGVGRRYDRLRGRRLKRMPA